MITSLEPNQVFVFGSNSAGEHVGGAAKYAKDNFGAMNGEGEGLTGRCYAFPTLTGRFEQRLDMDLRRSRDKFFQTARALPEKQFLMTAVGTGIAGYAPEYMKALFSNPPANVVLPEWQSKA